MYFTDNKKLQRFEHDMKLVPNFERKEIWEYGDSCRECKNYDSKIVSCMQAHCPYLKRKIRSNAVSTRDLVETFLADNAYIPFSHRVIDMLAKYRGNKLFISKWHKAAFEKATAEVPSDDYNRLACLYVLTIRPQISEYIVHTSNGYVCLSSNLIPKDMVLINFANDLYLGRKQISLKEISYRKYVSDKEFFYICNAILIRRFGTAVIKKEVN